MSEESDLNTYKLQLQQVEAALTTDPDNEELAQLKIDLEQVIALTSELIGAGDGDSQDAEDAALEEAYEEPVPKKKAQSRWTESDPVLPVKPWQVGERCQAPYADGKYYDCEIVEINGDRVSVRFNGYKKPYTTQVSSLQLPGSGAATSSEHKVNKTKRELEIKRKEYLKEKKKKKLEKRNDLLEAKEKEKKGWLNFSNKAFGKKGFVKKSIFKTPESNEGKVGVGTCGQSGQKMTDYAQATKYRKTF